LSTKHRMTPLYVKNNNNSLIIEKDSNKKHNNINNSRVISRPLSPLENSSQAISPSSKPKQILTEKPSSNKNPLVQSQKVSRQNSPKTNKKLVLVKTDIFKQLGNKATLTNNYTTNNSINKAKAIGVTPSPVDKYLQDTKIAPKKEEPVIKVNHNFNHNINHNIQINISHHHSSIRSTNISPLESTISKISSKESEASSKRSDILKPSSLLGKPKNSILSIGKLTELQKNQSKLFEKMKSVNEETFKKLKTFKVGRQTPVSTEEVDYIENNFIEGSNKGSERKNNNFITNSNIGNTKNEQMLKKQLNNNKVDNSISEEIFNRINARDFLNTSSSKRKESKRKTTESGGSLISEESIFSKKCKM
jgi:hypothetical protein